MPEKSILDVDYYDSPDGVDLTGKMVYANKWAAAVGFAGATVDVLMVSHTKGYLATVARYLVVMGPACAVASAYTVGSFASTRLRGKDDWWNQLVGSMAAGGVFGSATKRPQWGMLAVLALGAGAYVKRLSHEEGWEFFPKTVQGWGNFRSMKHDYTIMEDGERGWTR